MEISAVGVGFQHYHIRLSPIINSHATTSNYDNAKKNRQLVCASATLSELDMQPAHVSPASTTVRKTNSTLYSARRAAVVDVQNCTDLDSALARSGEILQVQDLNVILRHFGKLDRWQYVSQLFDWMQKHGKVNVASYSSYIKFMGKSHNPVKAIEVYNSIQDESTKINVSVCNSILGCLIKNGKFESSIKLFDQMKQSGLQPDAVTYSSLLAGCIKVKHGFSKAMQLVQEIKYNGLHTDDVIYGTLIAICATNNRIKEAEAYFEQMKYEGFSPNVFHYSSLLNAYSADGNYMKADELVKDMRSEGLVPNKVILTTLLKVYVRGGLFEKSRELLVKLDSLGYAGDEMPYCLLMDGLAKAGHIDEAILVFDEMRKKEVKSEGYSHSIMISAFCRVGQLKEAKQLARDYEARYDKYDLVMSNTLLRAFCRAGEMESVMQILRKMDELRISPDWNTFHILIKYFCKEKLYHLAYRTMEDMHSKGHQPDEELCSSLILHLGKVGAASEALSVYNMLRYSKRTMCKALHGKVLDILVAGGLLKDAYVVAKDNSRFISQATLKKFAVAFMKSGNINLINDVVKAVHSSGHKIDQEVFQKAILRYIGQPEKKELLLRLLQWMPGQGYVVDSSSRNLILKNSHLFGRQLIAEILSKQHKVAKLSRTKA
ncbi:PREDICTED: pentatricopeptide repeat-containing protein At1g10910, chloroplastic isoform X2 [Nelumbo nucifera]|uniref:Pentatricopeptide repeat-containing protein At1g10910, chloroplastic isoform X2 n=1 Tax=Nelumbo nucifera TaxID=4432 RepID=A0A1U7YRG6_NELNU|nr:PREDICTED: pentatricopeptide repeat-containing protein At1g10910, chloroplastic isoform X2 [Nelumbo nucifera]